MNIFNSQKYWNSIVKEKYLDNFKDGVPLARSMSEDESLMSHPLMVKIIEEYIASKGVPTLEPIQKNWVNHTTLQRLAAVIAHDYIKVLTYKETLLLAESIPVLVLYTSAEEHTDRSIQQMFAPYIEEACELVRFKSPMSKKLGWNHSIFMPYIMVSIYEMFACIGKLDSKISTARFKAWQNYKLEKIYLKEGEVERDSVTEFRGVELRSPGHKMICARLAEMGYMFFFEAPCVLLGDTYQKRFIDLVVIANNHAVIVEIDGGTHRTKEQQRDDNLRDHLIDQNWTNRIRIEHTDAVEKTDEMVNRIIS